MPGDHFYCLDFYGELAPAGGYQREGISGYVYKTARADTVPIYRWYNPASGDHFYTRDQNGELGPPAYRSEGIEWHMFKDPKPGTTALYRWWHSGNSDHFYTTDPTGELAPAAGYKAEGILGYLYPNDIGSGVVPLYRWYHSGLMTKFTFSDSITKEQRMKLLERHSYAYYRAGLTELLNPTEKARVRALYDQAIAHDVDPDPGVNGSAIVNGRQLWINFNNLFPAGDNEIAQTLLHEMMHCAGYTHPSKSGTPGDGGPYFSSPPLRAELAIAGVQSDETFDGPIGKNVELTCNVIDKETDERIKAAKAGQLK
jgi:uncharacterized protein DUF5648